MAKRLPPARRDLVFLLALYVAVDEDPGLDIHAAAVHDPRAE